MAKKYVHAPLRTPQTIRILNLQGDSNPASPIQLSLVQYELSNLPDFEAFSYTWDGQTATCTVLCEERDLMVTSNCEAILREFRPKEELATRAVWIDAICIDQSTDAMAERSFQIPMMGQIYRRAGRVLGWLGAAGERGGNLGTFESLAKLTRVGMNRNRGDLIRDVDEAMGCTSPADLRKLFLSVPWFTRLWVLQEVALSKKAVIFCGSTSVTFQDVPRVQALLGAQGLPTTHAALLDALVVGFDSRISALESLETADRNVSVTVELMRHARWPKTTEAKDKVFALYGLLEAYGLLLPQPDYLMSLGGIFGQTARTLITYTRKLEIDHQVHGMSEIKDLPSWAPDWSRTSYPQQPSVAVWAVRDAEDQSWSFCSNEKHLSVRGRILVHVSECANTAISYAPNGNDEAVEDFFPAISTLNEDLRRAVHHLYNIRALREIISFALHKHPPSLSLVQTHALQACLLSRTPIRFSYEPSTFSLWLNLLHSSERPSSSPPPPPSASTPPKNWMHAVLTQISCSTALSPLLATPEHTFFQRIALDSALMELHDHISGYISHQTLFKTQSGRLGMAPRSVARGDQIARLAGLQYPMVVRASDSGCWRLVAPAFVCGVGGEVGTGNDGEERGFVIS
ncbi:hypothetical protein HBH64_131350 [Parastagonospora nodorum]|nr:hypothetical protein HBH53_079120 [Parastagonospora nodorum]KAH4060982.1 hypothetical protein HBH49_009140 [Parastagonospora nodorum]KAH4124346.1 hypothetical protein HBH47_071530 [Parastagonospora nodorum]KAH4297718.1 hypothetical protein HBI01_134550 [Parastagonospora nodorum]KAH4308905.1 hypothetical protein HBI02_106140 [Parastagonospora nodorum]